MEDIHKNNILKIRDILINNISGESGHVKFHTPVDFLEIERTVLFAYDESRAFRVAIYEDVAWTGPIEYIEEDGIFDLGPLLNIELTEFNDRTLDYLRMSFKKWFFDS